MCNVICYKIIIYTTFKFVLYYTTIHKAVLLNLVSCLLLGPLNLM